MRISFPWSAVALLLISAVPVSAKHKPDDIERQATAAEQKGDYDSALAWYERALAKRPSDTGCIINVRRMRVAASQAHIARGRKLREQGDWQTALAEFTTASTQDPSSAIAIQEYTQTRKAIADGATKSTGYLSPVAKARKESGELAALMAGIPVLKPATAAIPSLRMNNQPVRVVYETVGKLAGIEVLFDAQFQPPSRNLNVEFLNAGIEQAFDQLSVLTHTFWKPLNANTIFVTDDSAMKRRDFEDNVARVFYVQNATSVQEFQELATAIRSLTEIKRVFTYNAQHAILVRGTPSQVALAAKFIHDLDKPKAEVLVDVLILQASSTHTRTLAAQIASTAGGLNIPVSFLPRYGVSTTTSSSSSSSSTTSSTTTSTAVTLANLGRISSGDFATTLPGALLNLVMADNRTRILQSPQVRASDGQKVTLKIGQKVPYASGSYSGLTTTTISSVVSTQFQYADVGVNVDLTPQVHGTDEVTLKVAVELSSVASHVTIGSVEQPVIAQQRNETEIRMREGEVNILSGLTQSTDSKSTSGIPGLTSIPVLGRVLGGESTDKERSELLIAIIPHIIRTPDFSPENLREVATGTDQVVKVSYTEKAPVE